MAQGLNDRFTDWIIIGVATVAAAAFFYPIVQYGRLALVIAVALSWAAFTGWLRAKNERASVEHLQKHLKDLVEKLIPGKEDTESLSERQKGLISDIRQLGDDFILDNPEYGREEVDMVLKVARFWYQNDDSEDREDPNIQYQTQLDSGP